MNSFESAQNPYASFGTTVVSAPATERSTFLKKTYTHLAAAIYLLVAMEYAIFTLVSEEQLGNLMARFFSHQASWLIFMLAFMGVSWIADSWARSDTSRGMQYAGLSLYVVAEAVFLVPLLYIAKAKTQPIDFGAWGQWSTISVAAVITLALFALLTAIVFVTGKDFSFLRTGIMFLAVGMVGMFLLSIFTGFHLGIWFSALGVALAAGCILYSTSGVMQHYRTDQYVAAALALFAAVVLMFWYVLQIVMSLSGRD